MVRWLTDVFQLHGFNLVEMLHVLRNHETLRQENADLQRRLGAANGLIEAIRGKIDELNKELETEKTQLASELD